MHYLRYKRKCVTQYVLIISTFGLIFFSCSNKKSEKSENFTHNIELNNQENSEAPEGMVWIPDGIFEQGALSGDKMAMQHERPSHTVKIDGFFIDQNEVTNEQFSQFVEETGYITIAEREIDWEEIKKQLPPGAVKPHDSILQPGSLVFKKTKTSVPNLFDYSQWWEWKIGTNWKHPNGPDSSIDGKENYPVVQISYEDAMAYCNWAGRRLPTEAEWEYAARGGQNEALFYWGNELKKLNEYANTWEGEFPVSNSKLDGFESLAPIQQYPKNDFGLFDMAGNVWEWTSDWYNSNYYENLKSTNQITLNPKGAESPYNKNNPIAQEKVIKGGSFLCSESYCASYRISARMATSIDSSMEHLGFRTVVTRDMLDSQN
ncbi:MULTISPECIES: formylglycine-generating enzyme family protein [Maribacter]|uniref:Formylglycine-generating enzyme family protein n=1 Tax=Maribacter flavus TaxID=1658664 RepID=A0ABU7IGC7_9FLAO|nr:MULTISPECIES: formylglycine-generating enzyme family protein [Maribacter]MDC6405197.1 formylglycine-generating enzyme family protein [Maribacter sp. PR66]MEE1971994.1 formylglycine-generating enzyme family protein [Maribacter flavus]